MEVQQEPAPAAAGARELPPAPHGAASVMATLMTDNGEAQSEGDTEMEQQAASGPSRSAAAAQVRVVERGRTLACASFAAGHASVRTTAAHVGLHRALLSSLIDSPSLLFNAARALAVAFHGRACGRHRPQHRCSQRPYGAAQPAGPCHQQPRPGGACAVQPGDSQYRQRRRARRLGGDERAALAAGSAACDISTCRICSAISCAASAAAG